MRTTKKFAGVIIGAGLFAVSMLITSAQAQGMRAECGDYAREAVEQYRENERNRCGYEGPRWSDAREGHFAWCLISPRTAAEETRTRRRMLQECSERRRGGGGSDRDRGGDRGNREGKRANCDTYSKIAEVQAEANEKYNCGNRGPEWSKNERGHFQWCMTNKREFVLDEMRHRSQELQKCFNKLGDYDDDNWDRNYRRRF